LNGWFVLANAQAIVQRKITNPTHARHGQHFKKAGEGGGTPSALAFFCVVASSQILPRLLAKGKQKAVFCKLRPIFKQ
jgi:hypothetical protein